MINIDKVSYTTLEEASIGKDEYESGLYLLLADLSYYAERTDEDARKIVKLLEPVWNNLKEFLENNNKV